MSQLSVPHPTPIPRPVQRIEGEVLRDNTTMLQMCGELGFKVEPDPEDPGLCRVVLDLSTPKPLMRPETGRVKGMPPLFAVSTHET